MIFSQGRDAKHRDIFKSNLAICLKRPVYNSCLLPAMTYGAETWTLTKQAQNKLEATQTKMERSMLNITYKDRKTNIWVRERTKLIDIIYTVRKMKWSWAGHINRLKDDQWTSRVTTWRPYDKKRRQGRPAKRWRDDLQNSGATYMASFTFLLVHCGSLVSILVLSSETECPVALQWSPTPVGMVRLACSLKSFPSGRLVSPMYRCAGS